jgi:glycerophosphoryl diester phosphodiesterase
VTKKKAWPYPRYAAHRGAGKLAPENTLAAMRLGYEHGYRMVEFDVKLSGDGVPFLLHDETLDRTTDARGRADALTWGELSKLDAGSWHSKLFAGEPLPTLATIARWARARDVACNIEIKPMPGRDKETGAAVALDARTLWRDAPVPPILSSFSEDALAAARTSVPELQRALLLDKVPQDWRERMLRLDCVGLDADYRELTVELVSAVREAGYKAITYTPNDPKIVAKLVGWGVDVVITDAIDVVRPQ